MIFAHHRPVDLGHDHAHQIVGLGIGRRDPHRVAGVDFGLGEVALAEQNQRQFLRCPDIVGIDRHHAPDQRLGRGGGARRLPDLVEHRQRPALPRRQFQHVQADPGSFLQLALGMRGNGAVHQRQKVPCRFARGQGRQIGAAATHRAQAAAAGARIIQGSIHSGIPLEGALCRLSGASQPTRRSAGPG